MRPIDKVALEHLYQQYLALKEILVHKLPLELVYKIAQIHFAQISGADLGFALFRVLWLGSEAFIEDYLHLHTFNRTQIQDAFNRLAFMATDAKMCCNGLDVASENFLRKHEWQLRWLIQKGASPFVQHDGDVPFILALEYGNMVMLKWFLEFASASNLRDELLTMAPEDFLRTLSRQNILNLPQEAMKYALAEAYEIHGLDSTVLYDI